MNFLAKTPFTSSFLAKVVRLTFQREANPGRGKTVHVVFKFLYSSLLYNTKEEAGGVMPSLSPACSTLFFSKADL
jgi:hypothetical protein